MKLDFEQRQRVSELESLDAEDLARMVVEAEAERDRLRKALKELLVVTDREARYDDVVRSKTLAARNLARAALEASDD